MLVAHARFSGVAEGVLGNDPEVVDNVIGESVLLVSKVETLITGTVLPVDGGDHTGGGVPCQT